MPTDTQPSSSASPSSSVPYEIKGYVFRGFVTALERRALIDKIASKLSPATLDALRMPPPSTAWVPGDVLIDIVVAVDALMGATTVRQLSYDAINQGAVVVLRPLAQGLLRLFGVSPHTLLGRVNSMASASNRGSEFTYTRTGERTGELVMTIASRRDVPRALFRAMAGTIESTYEACGAKGTISEPEYIADGKKNAASFRLAWQPKKE